LDYSFNSI